MRSRPAREARSSRDAGDGSASASQNYPGRWGLCLLLAGKFFHDHEDKQSRTLYAYTADHCWSPAHTHHAADEQGCSRMGIAFDRGPGLTC